MASLRSLLCASALALAAAAPGAHAATITEYPLPNANENPIGVAESSNGALWVATQSPGGLLTGSLDGTFTASIGFSGPAKDVASGPGGVWATEPGAIARVTAGGVLSEYTAGIPSGAEPWDIAAGPGASMWFTQWSPSKIGMVANPSGTIAEYDLVDGSHPVGIALGPDDDLWFTESGDGGAIGTIDPDTHHITEYTAGLTPNSTPTAITLGPDGNLWFTESAGPGAIGKITPRGTISEYRTGLTPNSDPSSITVGPDGYLWFTESADPGRIGRITPDGAITEYTVGLTANSDPRSIMAGGDGALWFTELADPGRLGRLALAAPTAITAPPADLASSTATLRGIANPAGEPTTYHFEWGTTTAYGQSAPAADTAVGTDSADHVVAQPLSGLQPNTAYHYRIVATSAGGTTDGSDRTFTTSPNPVTTSTTPTTTTTTKTTTEPATTATADAPPAVGHTAVAGVVSGTVLVRLPGSTKLVALRADRTIPLGALVDASHGVVKVTNALDHRGHTQSATVWSGSFSMTQARSGMTTFKPAGAPICPPTGIVRAHAVTRRAPAKLWSKDNHGHYSTRGRNSVATVRGTEWETIESCAGTRTVVKTGRVSVRDLRHHRTVLVRAGHSYLAKR